MISFSTSITPTMTMSAALTTDLPHFRWDSVGTNARYTYGIFPVLSVICICSFRCRHRVTKFLLFFKLACRPEGDRDRKSLLFGDVTTNKSCVCHSTFSLRRRRSHQRSYSYAKIFVSRDSDRVARDEPHH